MPRFHQGNGSNLVRPYRPPLTLAKNENGMYWCVAIFTTAELAAWAAALQAADRARQRLNVADGLHWSLGAVPGVLL
jgi:hypothetical protein